MDADVLFREFPPPGGIVALRPEGYISHCLKYSKGTTPQELFRLVRCQGVLHSPPLFQCQQQAGQHVNAGLPID
jgi:hypothetical protein